MTQDNSGDFVDLGRCWARDRKRFADLKYYWGHYPNLLIP